eukprot:gene11838-biopygen15448
MNTENPRPGQGNPRTFPEIPGNPGSIFFGFPGGVPDQKLCFVEILDQIFRSTTGSPPWTPGTPPPPGTPQKSGPRYTSPGRPRDDPGLTLGRPRVDPESFCRDFPIDPRSTLGRPRVDPGSTPGRPRTLSGPVDVNVVFADGHAAGGSVHAADQQESRPREPLEPGRRPRTPSAPREHGFARRWPDGVHMEAW